MEEVATVVLLSVVVRLLSGSWDRGGKAMKSVAVFNVLIGGSDLGPYLSAYYCNKTSIHMSLTGWPRSLSTGSRLN